MAGTQDNTTGGDNWLFPERRAASSDKHSSSELSSSRPDVLVGPRCYISGALQLDGFCVIDGTVEGEVSSSGELIVGESGVVKARITGSVVRIYGRVVGDIDCSTRLELKKGANVTGNISATSLVIEDGVIYQGYCTMTQRSTLGVDVVKSAVNEKNSFLELTNTVPGSPSAPEATQREITLSS